MKSSFKYKLLLLATTFTYIAMITVNALANILPINGKNTGEISDFYADLFAPIGFIFSIWGLIYLLLAAYTIYQLSKWSIGEGPHKDLITKVSVLFTLSSLANFVWIFAWHYDVILLSLMMMLVILVLLILINLELKKVTLTTLEKWVVQLPFSVYFGWISVATIANVTTYLVYIGWNRFGIAQDIWTDVILLIGLAITTTTIIRQKDIAYGLVVIWAYMGILVKHLSPDYFNRAYTSIIVTLIVSLLTLVAAEVLVIKLNNRTKPL